MKNICSKYVIIGIKVNPTPIEAIIVVMNSVFHKSLVTTKPGIKISMNDMKNWEKLGIRLNPKLQKLVEC